MSSVGLESHPSSVTGTSTPGEPTPTASTGLEIIAGAVAGRAVALQFTNQRPHTDGSTIFIPDSWTSDDVLRAVICQAALLGGGSLKTPVVRRLSRSTSVVAERYSALEIVRCCTVLDDVLPSGFRAALASYAALAGVTTSPEESLRRACGSARIADAPHWFGTLAPRQIHPHEGGQEPTDGHLAEAIRRASEGIEDEEEDEPGDRSRIAEMLSSPWKNPLGSALMSMLGAKRNSGNGNNSGGVEVGSVGRRSDRGNAGRALPRESSPVMQVGGPLVRGHTYPEWHHGKGRYRENWCTVAELDPAPAPDVSPHLGAAPPVLVRALARLGLTYRLHDGEALGDDLDLSALIDHRVRLAAGVADVPKVYRAERRTQQELGALVLLDATGSTAEHNGDGSLFEAQRQLACALTISLEALGVRVATYAFYSRGRDNVRLLRCKTFDERWSLDAQRRLASVEPSGFTRLGAAIRHGTHMLDEQAGTQHRLLLVVGDGVAYDDGYEGTYATEDCRRAVDEAGTHAVGCVGISASHSPEGASIWPESAHCVAENPTQLAHAAPALLGGALRHAARRATTTHRL